jgi:predicted membrane channel-forming protein YqfA (hemolysin III family)
LNQFTRRAIKLTVVIIGGYHCYQVDTKFYPISFPQGQGHTEMKLLGIINVGFDVTDQLLIRYFAFVRYWRKKWKSSETVHHLFVDFKKAYESVIREVLHNNLIVGYT